MRLAIDLDGVVVDWEVGYRALVERLTGVVLPVAAEWHWDREGLTDQQRKRVWGWIHAHPAWWLGLEPLATTQDLERLFQMRAWADVYFITSRPRGSKRACEEWLVKHGFLLPTVILTRDKEAAYRALEIERGIDDSVDYAEQGQRAGAMMVVRDQLYNREWTGLRVANLETWIEQLREGYDAQ